MADPDKVFRFGELRPQAVRALGLALENVGAQTEFTAILSAELEDARSRFKKLPEPSGPYPFRMRLGDVIGGAAERAIVASNQLVFHSVGDTGQHGHGALAQDRVALHLEQQLEHANDADRPAFFFHLGDVIYFNGELEFYPEQFYEPYRFYRAPIFAIPGNHDGDSPRGERSLEPFVENFCTVWPRRPPMPGLSQRRTMTQPNVYFTLDAPFMTVIGLYTNVTGNLDRPGNEETPQLDWFIHELMEADPHKFLVVALHHPPYSADNFHGPSGIAGVLDEAFTAAGRVPHLVLTAHVHNFQYFLRGMTVGAISREVPYLVAGAGGYSGYDHLHNVDPTEQFPDAVLKAFNDEEPGFLRLTVTPSKLTWEYFTTPEVSPESIGGDDDRLHELPALFTGEVNL